MPRNCDCDQHFQSATPALIGTAICFYILAFCSTVMNVAFIVSVLPHKGIRSFSSLLLVSNSAVDILLGGGNCTAVVTWYLYHSCWPFEHQWCIVHQATANYLVSASVVHMTGIAVERYIHAKHKKFHGRLFSYGTLFIITCWMLPTLTSYAWFFVPYAAGWYPYNQDGNNYADNHCSLQLLPQSCTCNIKFCQSYVSQVALVMLEFALPTVIIIFCYGNVMWSFYQRKRTVNAIRSQVQPRRIQAVREVTCCRRLFPRDEHQGIRMFFVILMAFIIIWSLYAINENILAFSGYAVAESIGHNHTESHSEHDTMSSYFQFQVAGSFLGYSNSLITPVLLFTLNKNYRIGFRRTWRRMCGLPNIAPNGKHTEFELDGSTWIHWAETLD